MQHLNDIPGRELAPGYITKLVHGSQSTLSIVEIKKGSILPEHHHVHEQITYILKGQLDMTIGGEFYCMTEGCVHVILPNVPHSAIAATNCTVIDAFSPAREDYK
jgi:quercetin dioxygenase-like cupin family protein